MGDLMENGLQWVAGPIFDKMKKLCEQDYPTFRKEYRKIRASPSYKAFRWDVKQACHKARNDDLEGMSHEEAEAARLAAQEAAARGNPHQPPTDPAKPYPASHTHFIVPKGGMWPNGVQLNMVLCHVPCSRRPRRLVFLETSRWTTMPSRCLLSLKRTKSLNSKRTHITLIEGTSICDIYSSHDQRMKHILYIKCLTIK